MRGEGKEGTGETEKVGPSLTERGTNAEALHPAVVAVYTRDIPR